MIRRPGRGLTQAQLFGPEDDGAAAAVGLSANHLHRAHIPIMAAKGADADLLTRVEHASCAAGSPQVSIGSQKLANPLEVAKLCKAKELNGGRDRDRTCDPYDVNVVLSR